MTILNTKYGGTLQASDLNALAIATLTQSYDAGKGVVEGMEVAGGPGLTLIVSPGLFRSQVRDDLSSEYQYEVPPNYDGYLWVEANSNPNDIPRFDHQGTDADYGTDWVCLGHFVSSDAAVVYDEAGRKTYGWRAGQSAVADVDSKIAAAMPRWCSENTDDGITGAIDGQNMTFQLSFTPIPGSLNLKVTGFRPGKYSTDGPTLTFNTPPTPGSTIEAQYTY